MAGIVRTGDGAPTARSALRRPETWIALALLAIWLWVTVPLGLGQRTLFFRDVLGNHFALKAFGAAELAAGRIPAFNPTLGLGQPFRGNPSALAFYPDNLLYLVLPLWSAFNLHYALHWLLALLTMWALARQLGQSPAAALLAGATYAGCGVVLSCLSFYNLIAVVAWWPLVLLGAARGGRRGIALGGLACGLALLAGEPLTAALGMAPVLLVAARRHGTLRGLGVAFAVGAVGLAVAAPQMVATLRVLDFTFRGAHGMTSEQVTMFALQPLRFLELFVPLPFGWPLDVGPHGWWLGASEANLSYYLSLYAGVVGLLLALLAVRRRPVWAALAAAGLLFAWLWGGQGALLERLTGGLFRFPQRFLFWYALALPLLAGWGLDASAERRRGAVRAALGGAIGCALLAAVGAVLRPRLLASWPADPGAPPSRPAPWSRPSPSSGSPTSSPPRRCSPPRPGPCAGGGRRCWSRCRSPPCCSSRRWCGPRPPRPSAPRRGWNAWGPARPSSTPSPRAPPGSRRRRTASRRGRGRGTGCASASTSSRHPACSPG